MRMLFAALMLTGCATTSTQYHVEKYAIEWDDTIVYPATHWHCQSPAGEWHCVELEADTIVLNIRDTIYIRTEQ